MTGPIDADDRMLIERTRKINKTLSMFVFALQEGDVVSVENQLLIADLLAELEGSIRARADRNEAIGHRGLVIDGASSHRLALEPSRETEDGP